MLAVLPEVGTSRVNAGTSQPLVQLSSCPTWVASSTQDHLGAGGGA